MWTCPKCHAGVDDDFEICWGCGTAPDGSQEATFAMESDVLPAAEDSQFRPESRMLDRLIAVASCQNDLEAHVLRSRLEAEGIHARVLDEVTPSTWPWGFANDALGIRVVVAEKDLERAQQVLAEDAQAHAARVAAGEEQEEEEDA